MVNVINLNDSFIVDTFTVELAHEDSYGLESAFTLLHIPADVMIFNSISNYDSNCEIDPLYHVFARLENEPTSQFSNHMLSFFNSQWSNASLKKKLYSSVKSCFDSEAQFKEAHMVINNIINDLRDKPDSRFYVSLIDLYNITDIDVSNGVNFPLLLNRIPLLTNWKNQLHNQYNRLVELATHDFDALPSYNINYYTKEQQMVNERKDKKKIDAAKKSIKKSLKLYNSLFKDDINAFIRGDDFAIKGQLYDYIIKKTIPFIKQASIVDDHSIPYSLSVMNKEGVLLGKLCVYFENTPIIDQVIAMTLHTRQLETEIEMLKTANMFGLTDAAYEDTTLVEMKNLKKSEMSVFSGCIIDLNQMFPVVPVFQNEGIMEALFEFIGLDMEYLQFISGNNQFDLENIRRIRDIVNIP